MGSLNPWAPMEQACYMPMDSTTRKRARKRSKSTYFRISVRKYRSENSSNRTILRSGSLLCAETLLVIRPSVMHLGEAVSINHMRTPTISHILGNVSLLFLNFKFMKRAWQWSLLSIRSQSHSWNHHTITWQRGYLKCVPKLVPFRSSTIFLIFRTGFWKYSTTFISTCPVFDLYIISNIRSHV